MIPNGVADDPPVRDRAALRAELGVAPGTFLAVLVAALRPEKRATVFVEQVAAAHAVEPSVRGLVVGDGPDAAAVARAAERSGGAVRMVGYRADAVDIMHAADVVCLTSAVEALPMSVIEAMSVARPGDRDRRRRRRASVVADGETGLVISPEQPDRDGATPSSAWPATRPGPTALGRAGRVRQRRAFSIGAMIHGYAGAPGGGGPMRPPHVVIVNQNAPLELDLRPRREAETLAAAGYAVTLVGGCGSPQLVRELTAPDGAPRAVRAAA